MIGFVNFWNQQRGFGFLSQSDGPEVFLLIKRVKNAKREDIKRGSMCEYEVQEGERGPFAANVYVVK